MIKFLFQKLHPGRNFEDRFKEGKIRHRVNFEAMVVDEDDKDNGGSVADMETVIVIQQVTQFSSQTRGRECHFPRFKDEDKGHTEGKRQTGIPPRRSNSRG